METHGWRIGALGPGAVVTPQLCNVDSYVKEWGDCQFFFELHRIKRCCGVTYCNSFDAPLPVPDLPNSRSILSRGTCFFWSIVS